MDWSASTIGLLSTGLLVAVLQIWWIAFLLQRNRRRQSAAPLSSKEFRQQLERIFSD